MDNEEWLMRTDRMAQLWLERKQQLLAELTNFEEEYCLPPVDSNGSICLD